MKKIWKRLWVPAIAFVLLAIGFVLTDAIPGDTGGAIGALTLFILFPLFVISLIWAIATGISLSRSYKIDPDMAERELDRGRFASLKRNLTEEKAEYRQLPGALQRRSLDFKLGGILFAIWGFFLICKGNAMTVIGTLILIGGVTLIVVSSPHSYNNSTDAVKMVPCYYPVTIEKIAEDLAELDTINGSPYLVKFPTMKQPAIAIGPGPTSSMILYGYLNRVGEVFYIGETFSSTASRRLTEPRIPAHTLVDDSTLADAICFSANNELLKTQFTELMQAYLKDGTVGTCPAISPSQVYTFDENFKLTGQSFHLNDLNGNPVYRIEGTFPLKTFYMYSAQTDDPEPPELFSMSKELLHALATYRFTRNGCPYGVLEKEVTLVHDRFVLNVAEGELVLEDLAGTIGRNFRVLLNGRVIGMIMENLSLNVRNLVFDNSIIAVYDSAYLDVITAMAVMAVREIARDREASSEP